MGVFLLSSQSAEEILMNSLALVFVFEVHDAAYLFVPFTIKQAFEHFLVDTYWENTSSQAEYREILLRREASRRFGKLVAITSRDRTRNRISGLLTFLEMLALLPLSVSIALWLSETP